MGVNYAMIITSCNGLWRYMIGDTVEFTSTSPYRIRITGRTKHYINAFGEEIVIDNAESAINAAAQATGAEISEYTAAPVFMKGRDKGSHEWVVEFRREPASLADFARELDEALQRLNSDYEAKRFRNTTLMPPKVSPVAPGTFMRWLADKGKIGGQNKVPRLFNDRTFVDELLKIKP
jgi:phenylacetate-coenzyme A ligase PaaK-like adenylate-forming protein